MARKRRFQAISVAKPSSMKVCKSRKLTSKILKVASEQQREIEIEETLEKFSISSFSKQAVLLDDFSYDVDETHSQDMGSEDMMSEKEERLLDEFFEKDGNSIAQRISGAVTSINKDDTVTVSLVSKSEALAFLQSLGKFMSVYTHGKMPKAFNHIASLENWDSLLNLTQPKNWSPRTMFKATKMLASSTKTEARFFYEHFLLPRVRADIKNHKTLHSFLYQSLKKALFKPDCFYNGILLPLCKSRTCTVPEAVIIASIMQKMSIREESSRDALVRLAEMTFCGTTSFFMKVILEKNYALAYAAIDAVTSHFLRFHREARVMPVIWHQTLLAFVQLYKNDLSKEDKKCLRSLLEIQNHGLITPHIVRELDNSINRGEKLIVSPYNKPVKEDLFDMPDVPIEEDY